MASLRRRLGTSYWFACFTLPDGRRVQRSTKLRDRKPALKLALEWEEAAANRITEAQARRVLSDIHEIIHGQPLETPTLTTYVAQWLARKTGEVAEVTRLSYKSATDDLTEFLGAKASQPIHHTTPATIASWRDNAARRASPRTANNKLKIVRVLFQAAWRDGLLSENPAAKVSSLRVGEGTRRPFTLAELKDILRHASTEWHGMILFGLYTGQRLKDIASLTWANADTERGEIRLQTSKTGRNQRIPMARALRAYLSELPSADAKTAPLFPKAHPLSQKAGGSSVLSQQFYGILVDAGLAKERPPKRHGKGIGRDAPRERNEVTFHSLRHTATSLLKNAGVSEAVARDIIGHESAEISRHYTHVDEEVKRRAIELLPDLA